MAGIFSDEFREYTVRCFYREIEEAIHEAVQTGAKDEDLDKEIAVRLYNLNFCVAEIASGLKIDTDKVREWVNADDDYQTKG